MFALWNKVIVARITGKRKITKVSTAPNLSFLKSFSATRALAANFTPGAIS